MTSPDKKYIAVDRNSGDTFRFNAEDWAASQKEFMTDFPDAEIVEYDAYKPENLQDNDTIFVDTEDGQFSFTPEEWKESEEEFRKDFKTVNPMIARGYDYHYNAAKELEGNMESQGSKIAEWEQKRQDFLNTLSNEDAAKINQLDIQKMSGVQGMEFGGNDPIVSQYNALMTEGDELKAEQARLEGLYGENPRVQAAREEWAKEYAQYKEESINRTRDEIAKAKAENVDLKSAAQAKIAKAQSISMTGALSAQTDLKGLSELQKLERLESANYFLDMAEDAKEGNMNGFWKGFGDVGSAFVESIKNRGDIANYADLFNIMKKLEEKVGNLKNITDEDIDNNLSESERLLLKSYFEYADALENANPNWQYKAGQIGAQGIKFAIEFALSAGAAGAVSSAATKGLTEGIERWAMNAIGKGANKWLVKAAEKTAIGATKGALNVVLQTALRPSTYAQMAQKATEIDEYGHLNGAKNSAISFIDSTIETISEMSGEAITKLIGLIPMKGIKGFAGKAFNNTIGKTGFGQWGKAVTKGSFGDYLRVAGFHGVPVEVLEEVVGSALRELTIDDKAFEESFGGDNKYAMAVGFLPLTFLGAGFSVAGLAAAQTRAKNASSELATTLEKYGFQKGRVESLSDFNTETNPVESSLMAREVIAELKRKGASQEDIDKVNDFVESRAEYQTMRGAKNAQEVEEVQSVIAELDSQYKGYNREGNVTIAVLNDGRRVFITSGRTPEGEYSAIDQTTGEGIVINESDIIPIDGAVENVKVEDYAKRVIDSRIATAEANRMISERNAQISELSRLLPKEINLGTTGEPNMVVVKGQDGKGVTVVDAEGNEAVLSWDEVGIKMGAPIKVLTDAQIAEAEAAEIGLSRAERRAQRARTAEQAQSVENEVNAITQEVKDVTPAPEEAYTNPETGVVDEDAFWENDPEGFCDWNDRLNQDGGVDSVEQIESSLAKLQSKMQETRKLATDSPNARKAVKEQVKNLQEKIDRLVSLQQKYVEQAVTDEQREQERADLLIQMRERVNQWRQLFGLTEEELVAYEALDEVTSASAREQIARAKTEGWYNGKKAFLFLPDISSMEELDKKVMHEVVTHFGLDKVMTQEQKNTLLDKVWSMMSDSARRAYLSYPGVSNLDGIEKQRAAANEFMAKVAESVSMNKATAEQKSLWQKIVDFFNELFKKVNAFFGAVDVAEMVRDNYQMLVSQAAAELAPVATEEAPVVAETAPIQPEASQAEVDTQVEQILNESGVSLMEDVQENIMAQAETMTDENGNVIPTATNDGTLLFSRTTAKPWVDNLGHEHKGTIEMVLARMKEKGFSEQEIKQMETKMQTAYDYMEKLESLTYPDGSVRFAEFNAWAEKTPYYKQIGRNFVKAITSLVSNGDYPINLELTTDCIKREAFTMLLNELVKRGASLAGMGPGEIVTIQKMMKQYGIQVACELCFVEGKRLQIVNWASQIVNDWNDALLEAGIETDEMFEFGKDGDAFIPAEEWKTYEDTPRLQKALRKLDEISLVFRGLDPETFKEQEKKNKRDLAEYKKQKSEAWAKKNKKPASEWKPTDDQEREMKKIKVAGLTPVFVNENMKAFNEMYALMRNEWIEKNPGKDPLSFTPNSQQWQKLEALRNNQIKDVKQKMVRLIMEHPEMRKKMTLNDLLGSKGLMEIRQQHGVAYEQLYSIILQRFGTGTPKPVQDAVPYDGEVMTLTESAFKAANKIGGARLFSFSDFDITKVFDYMQMFFDLEANRQMLQSYTKEVAAVLLFGRSNAKFNISTLAKAVVPAEVLEEYNKASEAKKVEMRHQWAENAGLEINENGDIVGITFSEEHSVSPDFAKQIFHDDSRNKDCGAIMVGVSVNHAIFSAAQDWIRMVIPFHLSGMPIAARDKTQVKWWTDNTAYQSTRKKTKDGWSKISDKENTFEFYADMHQEGWNMRDKAREYIDWCKSNAYRPKFDWGINSDYYRAYCEENGYTPNQQIIEMMDADTTNGVWNQYYKFLTDFTAYKPVFNEEGEMIDEIPSPQQRVVSNFDMTDLEKEVIFEGENSMLARREGNIALANQHVSELADRVVSYLLGSVTEEEMNLRDDVFYDARQDANAYLEATGNLLYSTIGERGAQNDKTKEGLARLDNLEVARQMETELNPDWSAKSDENALKIKVATGWERGADGKWRYEVEDVKTKPAREWLTSKKKLTLKDIVEPNPIFDLYPDLLNINIIKDRSKYNLGAYYSETENAMKLPVGALKEEYNAMMNYYGEEKTDGNFARYWKVMESDILHELQHAIQHKEGFALGGSPSGMFPEDLKKYNELYNEMSALIDEYNNIPRYDRLMAYAVDARRAAERAKVRVDNFYKAHQIGEYAYKRLAGEVESRNISKRMDMTLEDRRNTLLAATEDVDRKDQIILMDAIAEEQASMLFSTSNTNQAIFVSNAAKAVEGIKQEKATPEQWLKMIEKSGGLKAGEDKWMGLSDFLKSSDKKTLTKQEILDFINEHMIVIEEQHYSNEEMGKASVKILNEKYQGWEDAFSFEWDGYMEEPNADISDYEAAVELYNKHHDEKVALDGDGEFENMDDYEKVRQFGVELSEIYHGSKSEVRPIDGTREQYTTQGLQHLHEIALTVPTIESWNESDDIHFGDAGEGRAVAWIRFGETEFPTAEYKLLLDEMDRLKEVARELYEEFGGRSNELAEVEKRQEELRLEMLSYKNAGSKVLVIDEIQSKRHQAGREKGYASNFEISPELERLNEELDTKVKRRGELIRERVNKSESEQTEIARIDIALDEVANVRDYDRLNAEKDAILAHIENRDAEISTLTSEIAELESEIRKEETRLEYKASEAVPDAPFEKNWSELAMKRMLRYAAENGYDAIAWTKGEQQAERYNLGKIYNEIEREDNPNIEGRTFSFSGGNYDKVTVNEDGVVVDSTIEEAKGKPLSDLVGKDLAVKMMSLENYDTIDGEDLRIGGEGMKGFYDKMLPAFMNKYGKKWGIKVEDIVLPNLEEAGRIMHSVPVTDEMKESVMEGQVMFSTKGADESAKDFIQSATDSFYSRYNTVAPASVVYANSRKMVAEGLGISVDDLTDEAYKFIREQAKRSGALFVPMEVVKEDGTIENRNRILIFAKDNVNMSAKVDRSLFHENTHGIVLEMPELLDLGQWLLGSDERITSAIAADIKNQYDEEDWAEEMICDYVGVMLSLGRGQEALDNVTDEYKPLLNSVYERFGYKPEDEDPRRSSERNRDARELQMRNSENGENRDKGKELFSTAVTPEVRREMDIISAQAIVNGNYLKASNGKDTKLTPEQWSLVRTQNFKNWFGDWENDPENASKVVDENGEPMVVYHGTAGVINKFEDQQRSPGFWFVDREDVANGYAESASAEFGEEKNIIPVFLNIRKPRVEDAHSEYPAEFALKSYVENDNGVYEVFETYDEAEAYRQTNVPDGWVGAAEVGDQHDLVERAKELGYDGVIMLNMHDQATYAETRVEGTQTNYVVLDANQIKSATENNGEFSESEDIRFSTVYHGSPYSFDEFSLDHGKSGGSTSSAMFKPFGIYATDIKGRAMAYAQDRGEGRHLYELEIPDDGLYDFDGLFTREDKKRILDYIEKERPELLNKAKRAIGVRESRSGYLISDFLRPIDLQNLGYKGFVKYMHPAFTKEGDPKEFVIFDPKEIKVVKHYETKPGETDWFEKNALVNEEDTKADILFSTSNDKSVDEIVSEGKQKVATENREAADAFMNRIRRINGNLQKLRMAAAAQREYDQKTVKTITDVANDLLEGGALSDMTKGEIKRLLSIINGGVGKSDLTISINRLMDLMVANQLRYGKNLIDKFLKIRGSKVDQRGVEVRGTLDIPGQQMLNAFKEGIGLSKEKLADRIADAEDALASDSETKKRNAENELVGLYLAKQYHEDINDGIEEEKDLRNEMKLAHDDYKAGRITKEMYKQLLDSINEAILDNRIQRVNAYEKLASDLGAKMVSSIKNAGLLRDAEKERVQKIQHFANSDMQGMPADMHGVKENRFWNSPLVRFFLKPLATFDQMLRSFAPKSTSGEGYLWNHFMGGWTKATESEYKGVQEAHEMLDSAARTMFGEGVERWSDLFAKERKMPKIAIKVWDNGEMVDKEISQGNALYIYMVNKMVDGKMKLRKMGISQEDVDAIVAQMDPRFITLADWMQERFLPSLRDKYNAVHERLFGAPMASIDNYFPIKVNPGARTREVDVEAGEGTAKPATITGSIIKRTKNSLALDIMNADAFDVMLEHIQQMEHWAAFAEFNKDLNTLLSYRKFRNRVENMSGIYGSGKTVWSNFKTVAEIAAGVYQPASKSDSLDKTVLNVAKGVTGAKISFRVYTAIKQLLSMPAFVSDANIVTLAKNIATPWIAWNWAMENLPMFEKRWKSRQAGDTRLMQTDSDWKVWKYKIVELAGRYGMTPNAFIDAVTVSIGARSIYETKYQSYLDMGYSEEQADKKAKQDATVLFNESQQSNESAFLSAVQVDRTVASVAFTVFRNSAMGYQRMAVDAWRNISHMMRKGYKEESIEYMKKQMVRDGLTEEQAERAATRVYNRSFAKNAARLVTFQFLVQFAWNLGAYLPYLLVGDDDDEKKAMVKDAAIRGLVGGPIEGMAGGSIVSNMAGNLAMGEKLSDVNTTLLPVISDIEKTIKMLDYDKVAAYNEMFNILIQSGIGVNPQTFTDIIVAIEDACNGEPETSKEVALCIMRALQVPQSQLEKVYFDEIDFTVDKGLDLTIEEFAKRYANYKVNRGTPLTGWMYEDEVEKEREDKYIKRFLKTAEELKRSRGNEEAKKYYEYLDTDYKETTETINELRRKAKESAMKGEQVEALEFAKMLDDFMKTDLFQEYVKFGGKTKAIEAIRDKAKKVDLQTRESLEDMMLELRKELVEEMEKANN